MVFSEVGRGSVKRRRILWPIHHTQYLLMVTT